MNFGKLICWLRGKHRRGVYFGLAIEGTQPKFRTMRCPRCGAIWQRKIRKKDAT